MFRHRASSGLAKLGCNLIIVCLKKGLMMNTTDNSKTLADKPPFPTSESIAKRDMSASSLQSNPAPREAVDKVVQGAHNTIDRLATTAAPHVQKFQETLVNAGANLNSKAETLKAKGDEMTQSLRVTVRENPLAAVATALAVGMVIARLSR
jgi:ElaB/YqjD/DUF883 family membrane-anchored ribosome-binding protein